MAILQQIYPFTTAGNYTFPASIEVTGGVARLALADNAGQTFNQDFSASAGFTYDSDKTEFIGGVARQVNRRPANSTFYNDFQTLNASWGDGVLTGTPTGGASVSGGKLDLKGGTIKYVDYSAASNADVLINTGCIRFKYTPNYSGTPAADRDMICIAQSNISINNLIQLRHRTTNGTIQVLIYSSAGVIITIVETGVFGPVAGTEYEIELNFDVVAGATRLFVDGIQLGATILSTGVRSGTIGVFRVGSNNSGTNAPDCEFDDLIVFDTVQHTANYVPDWSLVNGTVYGGDIITLPAFNYAGIGNIQSFDNLVSTETNTPRWIINNQFWNGSAWAASTDSWATASPLATILSNLATLTVGGSVTFKLVTNDSQTIQQSADDLTLTYTGQIYNIGNPVIYPNSGVSTTEFSAFAATIVVAGSDAIRYSLEIDGTDYWWSGVAWVASSGYAETNTAAEINAQIATLNAFITSEIVCVPQIYLHSDTGATTPSIDELTIDYKPLFLTVQLLGFVQTITGGNSDTTRITVELNKDIVKYGTDLLNGEAQTIAVSSGQYDFDLVETDNMSCPIDPTADIYYIFNIDGQICNKTVPASVTVTDILSLPDYVAST